MMEKCKKCGLETIEIILKPNSVHYAEKRCSNCNHFNGWETSPDNVGQRNKTSKIKIDAVARFHNFIKNFCFHCLREKSQLGMNETLTLDHIQELSEGGKDEVENLQILCSACHKHKNWARLYMNWHFKEGHQDETKG